MNQLTSLIKSTGTSGLPANAADLESLLKSLVKDLLPVLNSADSDNPDAFLASLMNPGTNPKRPIVAKDSSETVWFKTPVEFDVVNLSQTQVNQAAVKHNVKSARGNSSTLSIATPKSI